MLRTILISAAALAAAPLAAPANAQVQHAQPISGTRLDVVATGEVTRTPDLARIQAGVVTQAQNATDAIRQNAARMESVRSALRRAGIEARDIQTSTIALHPEYRYAENQPPQLVGYRATNEVTVRFRDIANTGRILDALVAEGANQISGPMLTIDRPEAALDEARTRAIAIARERAELYAGALGMRVARVLSVSEAGMVGPPMPVPVARMEAARDASTQIDPGEQTLGVTLTVSFELQ